MYSFIRVQSEAPNERSSTMNDLQRYLADEFVEDYQEGRMSRRATLKVLASIAGSMVVAEGMLAACAPLETATPTSMPVSPTDAPTEAPTAESTATQAPQSTATVSADDPEVDAAAVEFPSGADTITGYLAHPKKEGKFPVILVCHENRGLTPHIEDVTRRLAKAGYVGLAVDLLSRLGGSAQVGEANVPGALGSIAPEQFVQDFKSGWDYLKTQAFADAPRVGMVGFCFGGGVTWRMAVGMPELKAAVPFYGPPAAEADVPKIQAAVLAIYGANDQRITGTAPAIEAAMKANNKIFEKIIYPNADHAFHNDTGTRYNAEAATDAWKQTLAWFAKYV
jgi:carboxymethylenebutenolidase